MADEFGDEAQGLKHLESARVNSHSARGVRPGGKLVDDERTGSEPLEFRGQSQARRTCSDDEDVVHGCVAGHRT